eukprot:1101060-Pleurochrysis_carterae.AAC.1
MTAGRLARHIAKVVRGPKRAAQRRIEDAPRRCYQLRTRELISERARVYPVGTSTLGGGQLRKPRDGLHGCVAAWVSEGVVIRNEVK